VRAVLVAQCFSLGVMGPGGRSEEAVKPWPALVRDYPPPIATGQGNHGRRRTCCAAGHDPSQGHRSASRARRRVRSVTGLRAMSGRGQGEGPRPTATRRAWALIDADTGLYLAGKEPEERVSIASTTKIMVALVALDEGVDFDEQVTVSEDAASYAGSVYSNVGLYPYDRVSVRDLLTAALVPSGTDAVYALAEHLGDGSVDEFVAKMNDKAKELDLENTHFENPAGIDARGNHSSAADLATITREAMKYPVFREIVDEPEATISTQDREIEVFTTNLLVLPNSGYDYGPATGAKTGTSTEAGPCLVASAKSDDESYIVAVLGAAGDLQRFDAARTALGYGFQSYDRGPLVDKAETYKTLTLPYRPRETVALAAMEGVFGPSGPGLEVERRITAGAPPPEVRAGEKLGTLEVFVNGRIIGTSPLVAKTGYEVASPWQKAQRAVAWPAQMLWAVIEGWISKRVSEGT
jgi:serine-type D-Ala-D-Ala carboxypeptidase (penicillin-binding protein 5/6)